MKVIAFNGSARKDGNTAIMIKAVFRELEAAGAETQMIQLSGGPIHGCRACYACMKKKDRRCGSEDDGVNAYIEAMVEADGIILASPTYFADVSPEIKALIDRAGMVSRVNDDMLRRKVGAGIAVARRGGSIHAFDSLNHFFLISQMIIPGSSYWNLGFGKDKGDVEKDEEAMAVMKTLGQNMAWLIERTLAR